MEKPIQSKPQSPVIQATAGSPKFSRLKQSQAQSKPTTPEKTELPNGDHARSGLGKSSSENGEAHRERGSSFSSSAEPSRGEWAPSGVVGHTGKGGLAVKESPGGSLFILGLFLASPLPLLHGAWPVRPDGSPEWSHLLLLLWALS